MDKIYKARCRFTGEVVTGFNMVVKKMMGVSVAVLITHCGERNCYVDSVEVIK